MFDLVIRNGRVCDGTGNPWFHGDIGIKGDLIVRVGRIDSLVARGARTIDAVGKVVAPGFVDVHTHSDYTVLMYPRADSMVYQGVTTVVSGNCGSSPGPVHDASEHYAGPEGEALKAAVGRDGSMAPEFAWRNLDEYFSQVARAGASVNVACLVGHGTVRRYVMGNENRQPTTDEMKAIKCLLREAVEQGAIGWSTGLIYVPGSYARTEELVEISDSLKDMDGLVYATHTRSLSEGLFDANEEAMTVGRAGNARVQLSHMCPGAPLWGRAGEMLASISEARERGLDVTLDMFPYRYGGNSFFNMVPPWAREVGPEALVENLKQRSYRDRIIADILEHGSDSGRTSKVTLMQQGKWDHIWVFGAKHNPHNNGLTLEEIAADRGKAPFEVFFDLIIEEGPNTRILGADRSAEDVDEVLRHPAAMVGSDGRLDAPYGDFDVSSHPRSYGTFARVLSDFVRERRVLSLEEAIRKMSSLPAQSMGITNRGIIREGMAADMVVFDPVTVRDRADIPHPKECATGFSDVLVNGQLVVHNGAHTGCLSGQVFRR